MTTWTADEFIVLDLASEDDSGGWVGGDFGRELAFTRAVEPSVIILRQLPNVVRAADVAALLLANLTPAVTSALDTGAFVVLTPTAVRHLPQR